MNLFELLAENTNKQLGSWILTYNEHHDYYVNEDNYPDTYEKEVIDYYIREEQYTDKEEYLSDIEDFKKHVKDFHNVYELCWYKDTPIGSYSIYGDSIEEIEKQVKEFLNKKG